MKKLVRNRRTSIYIFVVLFIISSVLNVDVGSAAEEEAYTIESLYTSIRPEYDHPVGWQDANIPAVLVVNQLDLVNNTEQPITSFSFPAPIDAPNFFVFATGKLREQGQYWPAPHVLSEGQIHINLQDQPILPDEEYTLVVQYYYNPFTIEGAIKSFNFEFAPENTIPEVRFDVQLPTTGRNGKVEPAKYALSTVTESDVNRDNPIKVDVSYEKADNVPMTGPLNSNVGNSSNSGQTDMKFVIFVVLLIGIAIAAFVMFGSNNSGGGQGKSKKKPYAGERSKQKAQNGEQRGNRTNQANRKQVGQAKQANQSGQTIQTGQSDQTSPAGQTKIRSNAEGGDDQQKLLRKQLLSGEIDEATYQQKMKKLN